MTLSWRVRLSNPVETLDDVCNVPVGTGILLLAVDANQVDHNNVLDNDSFGIAVANFCTGNHLPPGCTGGATLVPCSSGAVPRGHSPPSVRPGATRATWRPTRNGMSWAEVASANRGTTESPTAPAT